MKPRNANVLKRNWMKRNRKAVLKARRLGFCTACRRRRPRATYTICDKCRRYQKDRYSRRLPAPATGLEKLRDFVKKSLKDANEAFVFCGNEHWEGRAQGFRCVLMAIGNLNRIVANQTGSCLARRRLQNLARRKK